MKASEFTKNHQIDENLRNWFKEKWVRFGPDGKIRGDCARGDDSEGKPKCLPQSKAHSLGKKGRASAAARKRREDPNAERSGRAINVNTKKKTNEAELDEACWKGYHKEGNKKMFGKTYPNCVKNTNEEQHSETCPHCGGEMVSEELMNEKKDACYYKVKSRYKVWPSAYASGALVKCRKKGADSWGNGGKSNESVAESEDIRPQGKILKKLHDIAYSNPALTFQNFRQSGKEAIITDAIMACKVLKHHYLQNKNQPTAQIIYNLENELDNFMRGRKLPTPDGNEYTMDLSDLLKGTLGKMRFQQKVDEEQLDEKWTKKYKDSINCSNPKGFSQRAHCAGRNKNEDVAEGRAGLPDPNDFDSDWEYQDALDAYGKTQDSDADYENMIDEPDDWFDESREKVGNMDADAFDDALARIKKLAGAGPLKTVYDPTTRRYKNVPIAVQPTQQPQKVNK